MGTPEESKTKKPEPDSRYWWFQVASGLGMEYAELKRKLDRAELRIKSMKLGGEALKANLREAESYIFEIRGALLFYFGTTDPELLADVWKGSAEAHDAALATERSARERAERALEQICGRPAAETIRILDVQDALEAKYVAPAQSSPHHELCASIRTPSDIVEGITKPCNCRRESSPSPTPEEVASEAKSRGVACNCAGVYRDPDFVGHRPFCPAFDAEPSPRVPTTEPDQ